MRMNAEQAAEYIGIPLRTFYYLVQQGRIERYIISPRVTRYEQADLDAFLKSCRSDSTKRKKGGVSNSTVSLTVKGTGLLDSFLKAGVKIKPEHLTRKKAPVFSLKVPDSKNQNR